ncbi:WD40 repeat domain-containing protein [Pseudobacteroides cellulosolvens]|uniref:Uncharacterized protein n=1 Tax=Pseudobacteroides cellulosolvens ATCC 35603 = DSM 2933 TaxID=398512 RepID=A0A0L6JIJ8_9FIRM|nr:hypothetical protein [Pseudobacteroides cellulosolvens]KNY25555.1 hypothetical protein Bccel_0815 [Pseudobacteroides cellulosolvens ATCC 35603 = DSM 2933]
MYVLIHPDNDFAVTLKSNSYIKKWDIRSDIPIEIQCVPIAYPVYNPDCNCDSIVTVHMRSKIAQRDNCLLNIYSWDDLKLIAQNEITDLKNELFWFQSLSISQDGKTIALASFNECLAFINQSDFKCKKVIDGGEWTSGLVFDNNSKYIAAAHTFQGGGYISIYENFDEDIQVLHESLFRNPELGDFSDSVAKMAFTSNGKYLVVCEVSVNGTGYDDKGKLILYETFTGKLVWAVDLKSDGEENVYPDILIGSNDNLILCGMGVEKYIVIN